MLLSKVYDGGLQDEGTVRYVNVTLGLATNLTARMEQGDSGHNDGGEEPTDEEIETILRKAFPIPHEVTQNEDGSFRITLWADMTGPVKIPDNIGSLTLDMNGYHIVGTNGVNGADGGNALVFTDSGDVGETTELTVVEANEKYNPEGDIVGGDGADGQRPGKGGAAICVDTKRGVVINVEGTVLVIGGKGGALLDGDKGDKPGTPGAGVDPQDTRGDRAPGSVQEGEAGGDFKPWAKAKLNSDYSADEIAPQLPEGVTVVGNELWFWKRTTGEVGEMIGFDFGAIDTRWIDDGTIRFAAGQFHVDQFTCDSDLEGLTFVGADSAAVVIEDKPFTPVKPEEEQMKPVLLGGKGPVLPDLGKHTVLVSTGKSIFQSRISGGHLLTASGPLGEMGSSSREFVWRNLAFTALPGTEIEGGGGAISVENVATLTVADCAFADLTAGQMGGAIYAAGLGDGGLITNSTFTGCSVDPASGLGGAIYAVGGRAPLLAAGPLGKKAEPAPLTVADCVFTLNEAESGGAICTSPMDALEEPIALEIVRSTFNGNTAEYNGGAICAVGKVTIADSEAGRGTFFAYNEAGVYGGALAIDGVEDAHVDNEVFVGSNTVFACNMVTNDWAGEALGGAINLPENCTLSVRNALFTNNVAACTGDAVEIFGVYGGAICTASGCESVIEKTYFVDNRAVAGGSTGDRYAAGGALSDVESARTFVDTCVFDGNLVEGQAAVGAALDLEYDAESAVVNSTFRRSNVEAVSAYATPVVIRNCVVVDNGAEADIWIEETLGYELTFTAYGKLVLAGATEIASSNNLENCVAAEVYRGETVYLATNEYNKVAALGYPQSGVTDIEGAEYGSKFWGTSMGAFETPAIYPIEELGFEIAVDPLELAWTGTRVHPTSVVVTNPFTRVELTEGVDYTVSFENDVDSTDKALVVVTGIGDYSGTATTNYWITSYLVRYYACEKSEGDVDDYDRLLEEVQLGSLNGSNVVAKIAPPTGYVLDPFHEGTLTNGTVTLFDGMVEDDAHGRLVLKVFYAKSSGGDDNIPDKYQRKITYKVVNGWWDDPDNGLDHTVWVTLLDEEGKWSETGTGTLEVIPTVGNTPFSGYAKTGVWYPAEPSVSEMTISREYPAIPFFLYVYCPQPQGGSGRGGRGGTAGTVTDADLDALRSHLATKFTFTKFAFTDGKAAGEAWASVVDESTGKTLVDVDAAGMKLKVLGTTDLSSGEWTPVAQPTTDGEGAFSFELPDDGASQQFFKLAPVEK
ncbi:MAG: hypothetical protein MJ138_02430 [Kiritimatiellae bacterium]|nr:hypothetical protein [Kiritimatiellia bacterium]